jgi:tRNA dimethylallyltransferase
MAPPTTIAILGPTASGKSDLAAEVARRVGGEVVSVDSMQVYRDMDIGTAKPGAALRSEIPHHMLDLCDPEDEYSVAEFQETGHLVMATMRDRGCPAVVCGGSGLHFRSLVDPLEFPPTDGGLRAELEAVAPLDLSLELLAADPAAGEQVDLANPRRVVRAVEILRLTGETPSGRANTDTADAVRSYEPLHPFIGIGVDPGDGVRRRAERRLDAMLAAGLLDEVTRLASRLGVTASQAVGYKELLPVVTGNRDLASARDEVVAASLALAKRQRTFFGRDPRIDWVPWDDDPAVRWDMAWNRIEEQLSWTS